MSQWDQTKVVVAINFVKNRTVGLIYTSAATQYSTHTLYSLNTQPPQINLDATPNNNAKLTTFFLLCKHIPHKFVQEIIKTPNTNITILDHYTHSQDAHQQHIYNLHI